ncbi:MAG: LPS translocon maturation chaperone LptM, partial [Bradyrhizobium sp.]
MISNWGPRRSGWAVLAVGAVALTLAGCGRKGPLDLPPTAASASTATTPPQDAETAAASKPTVFNPSFGMNAPPKAAKGPKKPFILDPLLGT